MTTSRLAFLFSSLLAFSGLTAGAAAITFEDQAALDAAFPAASRGTTGGFTVSLLDDPERVSLRAGDNSSPSRVTLYSAAGFSGSLDFVSAGLTLAFDGARLNFSGSGSSYNGRFGLTSSAGGAIGGVNAIYFQINRNDQTLSLVQSVGGTTTALHTWTNSGLNFAYDNITSLTLTLTATTWEVSGAAQRKDNASQKATISGSGSLGVAWTAETWGETTFIGLEASQTSNNTNTRWAELQIGAISFSPIPEPGAAAALAGAAGLVLAGGLRRRVR